MRRYRRYAVAVIVAVLVVALGVLAAGCSGNSESDSQPSSQPPASSGGSSASTGTTDGGVDPAVQEAQQLVEVRCSMCHSLDRVWAAKKTRDEWVVSVDRMKRNGLVVTEEEYATIVDHLASLSNK